MTEKQFYRPDEVAEILRISIATVYKLIRTGKLHAIRIGTIFRIPAEAVADMEGSPSKGDPCKPGRVSKP